MADGVDYSVKSDKPLHGANYIHIAASDGTSRILRRVDTSYFIDYHTYLTRYGLEGRSVLDRVALDQTKGSYIEGVILDNPQDVADSMEESFEFIQVPHSTDPNKFYYILNLYLRNDEHTVTLYEIEANKEEEVTKDEPLFRYVIEDYSKGAREELKSYKVVRIQSANFQNDDNIIDYHKALKSASVVKLGRDEILKKEVVSSAYLREKIVEANHIKASKQGFYDKRNELKLTVEARENTEKIDDKWRWGVSYPKGITLTYGKLKITSLIDNNIYHPLQIGSYEIENK